ncbi:MAG: hypothetical protein QI223_04980 [Candidatus Korarchaeota archaeon]|nr:hypothetical protein [Candidatus Korarchaeota archaeon]
MLPLASAGGRAGVIVRTGVEGLDRLLGGGIEERSLTEFYSPSVRIVGLLYHRIAVLASAKGRTLAVHVQDFGGLDPYMLRSMARRIGADWRTVEENLMVARAFKLEDALDLLSRASREESEFALVFDPYLHVDWREAWTATRLTQALRELAADRTVVSFNRCSLDGRGWSPLGGTYHAHSIHAVVRLDPRPRGLVRATLVKHPSRPQASEWLTVGELGGASPWEGLPRLSEWL